MPKDLIHSMCRPSAGSAWQLVDPLVCHMIVHRVNAAPHGNWEYEMLFYVVSNIKFYVSSSKNKN